MTVSAFFSASLEPLLIGVCLDNSCQTLGVILRARHFAVNILGSDQAALSDRFAKSGNENVRFSDLPLLSVPNTHSPLISGALVHMDCTLHSSLEAGDHTLCLGEPNWIQHSKTRPLVFQSWKYRQLAEEPSTV